MFDSAISPATANPNSRFLTSAMAMPPRANAAWYGVDGAITFVAADDPVEVARRQDDVAKRARYKNLRDEADARGWSSAIPERSLALRRRLGHEIGHIGEASASGVAAPLLRRSEDVFSWRMRSDDDGSRRMFPETEQLRKHLV